MTSVAPETSTHLSSQSTDSLASIVSVNAEISNTLPTLSSTTQHIATSTESPLQPSSEYTSKITDELTSPLTTINDQYQTSAEISSTKSDVHSNQITMQTNTVLSTSNDNTNINHTATTTSTQIEAEYSLTTSSDYASNIQTITLTSSNSMDFITNTQKVFEDKLSSTYHTEHQTTYFREISTNVNTEATFPSSSTALASTEGTTLNQDQSSISSRVIEPLSSSDESSSLNQTTTSISETTFSTLSGSFSDTSKISDERSTSTIQYTNKISTSNEATVSSVASLFHPTDVPQNPSPSSVSSIITVDKITTPATTIMSRTITFSTITSTATDSSISTENTGKTLQYRPDSTIGYGNEETISTTLYSTHTQTLSETSRNIMKNSQAASQTSSHLSSHSATMPFTAQDTARLQFPTTDISMSDNSNIATTNSDSSPYFFNSTMAITSTNQSSTETSSLPSTTTSKIEMTASANADLSTSRQTSLLSSEPGSYRTFDTTSTNSFTTMEFLSTSIENQFETSTEHLLITNPISETFKSASTISSIPSSSSTVSGTSNMIMQDTIGTTQTNINP
ncbi:unnamed protein product, partial [Rotaria sp. Silwood1]